MAQDDMVPDNALILRMGRLAEALRSLRGIVDARSHLANAGVGAQLGHALERLDVAAQNAATSAQPDDEVNAKYRSRMRRECFPTYPTNVWYHPFDPRPDEVYHADIVWALVNINRFGGHSARQLSVGEHSIKVAAIAEHLIMEEVRAGRLGRDYAALAALYGIVHDFREAYVGDVIGPIRRVITHANGIPWDTIEEQNHAAIVTAYGLPAVPPEVEIAVRTADVYAFICEATVLKKDFDLGHPAYVGLSAPPAEVFDIALPRMEGPSPEKVRKLLDGEVRRLVRLFGGRIPWEATAVSTPHYEEQKPTAPPPPSGTGSWRSKVASSQVDVPSELLDEPEFKDER